MYPVFPAAVFRFYEKISPENRFSATFESYFCTLSRVILIYLICRYFVSFWLFYACLACFRAFSCACNSHFVSHFYVPTAGSGNCLFCILPFSNICFMLFCTFFNQIFLQLEKVHKISKSHHRRAILPPL